VQFLKPRLPERVALFQLVLSRGRAQLFHFCRGGEIFLRDSSFLFVDGNFFLLSLV
jgi:hypothetical protein